MKNVIFLMVFMVMTATCCEKPGEPGDGGKIINSTLVCSLNDGPSQMDWAKADDYCKNLVIDGYDDWRLPTWDEMVAIYAVLKPANETDANPWEKGDYWTSDFGPTDYYMGWYCYDPTPEPHIKTAKLWFRPVRNR